MTLNLTGESYVITMKNEAQLEEELTCHFKIDTINFKTFDRNTRKAQGISTLIGCF